MSVRSSLLFTCITPRFGMRLPFFDVSAMVQIVAFGFCTMQYIAIVLDT